MIRRSELRPGKPLARGKGLSRSSSSPRTVTTLKRAKAKQAAPRDTGFSPAVKLAVRTRAGDGDVLEALCEACGRFLGRYGGQVHHRMNRQSGGSKLRNGIQNAALLCGTPDDFTTCHGKATRLDDHMRGAGWVLETGRNPALEPVMLHGRDGGMTVWLTEAGGYTTEPPEGAEAA